MLSDNFYTYIYLREDGTPYYVGKGSGKRAYWKHRKGRLAVPRDKNLLVIQEFPSEAEAFEAEKFLIALYGRKDNGTGILRNLTDGGEGISGLKFSEAIRHRLSAAAKTRPPISEETRNKLRAAIHNTINSRPRSAEHRKNNSKARAKLTGAQVIEIRRRAESETYRELMQDFEVSAGTISLVVNGVGYYKHEETEN
jgi:hypothetical protein